MNDTELGPEWLHQWADAELVEQVELLEAQVESLKAERYRLKMELHFSRGLAARVADEPASFATLEEDERGPIFLGRLLFLIGIVAVPLGLIASFVYLV